MKRRIMITVAYDGTDYHGWQFQEGVPTIEGALSARLLDLTGEECSLTGASRTDAGVHALGNVAVFDTESRIPAEKFPGALNARLPGEIRVLKGQEVDADFHPRHCHSRKTYEYRILNSRSEDPLRSRYVYWYYGALDMESMRRAAEPLVGEHDFTSFCSVHAQSETRVRTICSLDVLTEAAGEEGKEIVLRITGNGFLYNMVRIIAGTLIDVGRGQTAAGETEAILLGKDRALAGPTAPAKGLTLKKIEFPDGLRPDRPEREQD